MLEEFEEKRRRQVSRTKSIMDYSMGIIFILAGIYLILYPHLGWTLLDRKPSMLDYYLGALFILYGGWRIYRGYKKNYFV